MSGALPLFDWRTQRQAQMLEAERDALQSRIAVLPRHAHKRIELEVRLRQVTAQALALETHASRECQPEGDPA